MAVLREIPLPEHLNNMVEFRLLDEVSDRQMSDYKDEVKARHDDILITTATKTGIERREKVLGILPDPEESLESRRTTVLFWWYNRMPYSRKVVESKVRALCGDGNYTFEYDPIAQELHVGIRMGLGWEVINTVKALLDRLVMLNVILDVRAVSVEPVENILYMGSVGRSYSSGPVIRDNV